MEDYLSQPTSGSFCIRWNQQARIIVRACAYNEKISMQALMRLAIREYLAKRGYELAPFENERPFSDTHTRHNDWIAAARRAGRVRKQTGRRKRKLFGAK